VARVYGFENIPALPPVAASAMLIAPENTRSLFAVRHQLADLGYQEVVNMSFVESQWETDFSGNEDQIKLQNPIASQMGVMRSSLIGSLVANVRYNLNRKAGRVRVFEIGAIFKRNRQARRPAGGGRLRPAQARGRDGLRPGHGRAVGRAGPGGRLLRRQGRPGGPVRAAGAAFRQGRASGAASGPFGRIEFDGVEIGFIGELHPRWLQKYELPQAPVLFEVDAVAVQQRMLPKYEEISKFPGATRDRALIVKQSVSAQELIDTFKLRKLR
jgi:phenylalanyl-tRNA synthetase beta chain